MSITKSQIANIETFPKYEGGREDLIMRGKMVEVESILADYAKKFINAAQRNLRAKHKVDTGILLDMNFEVTYMGKNYVLTVGYEKGSKAEQYWDFVNKGVAGVGKSLSGSPYKFRTKGASKKMIDAMQGWISRHNIQPSDKYAISPISNSNSSYHLPDGLYNETITFKEPSFHYL